MNCKFLSHGIALQYGKNVKPCCVWKETDWNFPVESVNFDEWFNTKELIESRKMLEQNMWPANCVKCQKLEEAGRGDSMRLNAESAYGHYNYNEITLEIRPGNTCNFACQTCWPEASSRVSSFHKRAFGTTDIVSESYTDFSILDPIADRIADVVLLGGEPFYDKNCLAFIDWCKKKDLSAGLLIFSNGSMLDWDFVENYKGKLTIVISLDAIGKVAEYIRQGTDWETVLANYTRLRNTPGVDVRVNITSSVYNYPFISELVEWLAEDWPGIVTFGTAFQPYLQEAVVPKVLTSSIATNLETTADVIWKSNIPEHQQWNASNALKDIANKLRTVEFDENLHAEFLNHSTKLDMVKNMFGEDYDPYFEKITKKLLT